MNKNVNCEHYTLFWLSEQKIGSIAFSLGQVREGMMLFSLGQVGEEMMLFSLGQVLGLLRNPAESTQKASSLPCRTSYGR